MGRPTWGARRKGKAWWTRDRDRREFIRRFVVLSYEQSTGNYGKYSLKSPVSHKLIKTAQVLMDHLLETGDLNKIFWYDRHPYMAGHALFFTFFGMDFRWITHGKGEFEPLPGDELFMDQELFDNYQIVIGDVDVTNLVNEIQKTTPSTSRHWKDYYNVYVGVLYDIIHDISTKRYYNKNARPVFDFEDGDIVIGGFDIGYDYEGNLYAYIHSPGASGIVADFDVVGKTLGSIVRWQDVDLPFHAWDMGFSEGPVDE